MLTPSGATTTPGGRAGSSREARRTSPLGRTEARFCDSVSAAPPLCVRRSVEASAHARPDADPEEELAYLADSRADAVIDPSACKLFRDRRLQHGRPQDDVPRGCAGSQKLNSRILE